MSYQPTGILVLHGFTASLDCVRGIAEPLAALGYPVSMPLLSGHGQDSPAALEGVTWYDYVRDAEAAYLDLRGKAEKVIIIGHSLGGLLALNLAAGGRPAIDSLVVAATPIRLTTPFGPGKPLNFLTPLAPHLLRKMDLPPVYADPELIPYDTNYEWAPTAAIISVFQFIRLMRQRLAQVTTPTLILQSRADTTVDPVSAEILFQELGTPESEKEIIWFEKTEHEMFRDLEREAVTGVVQQFVRRRTQVQAPA